MEWTTFRPRAGISDGRPRPRFRPWHAALLAVGANLLSRIGVRDERAYYRRLERPPYSPPASVFAPVWIFNNLTSLWAALRIANLPSNTPGRRTFLALEGAGWGLYAAFTPTFFGLRSPVLGAADSAAYLATTAVSTAVAARVDPPAAVALLPRLAWLSFATYLAVGVARRNRDELFTR